MTNDKTKGNKNEKKNKLKTLGKLKKWRSKSKEKTTKANSLIMLDRRQWRENFLFLNILI